jgi:hypothetical protein
MGSVLLLAGVLGFFQNPLLGLFEVNAVHNVVHLASGALTLLAARQGIGAMRIWGKTFGLVYLAVAIAGWLAPGGDLFGLMHLNLPDNVLHVALAMVFLYFGLLAPPRR